jgi:hypothetical protein
LGRTSSLKPKLTSGAQIKQVDYETWRLEIPAGPRDIYRLAQLDDYNSLNRSTFPWKPPFILEVRVRASSQTIPGTWGFGLWNDPFNLSLGFGGGTRKVPALPNAAWFFFASPPNYLSLRDDLPAVGNLAATFHSRNWPTPLLILGAVIIPLLIMPPLARIIRRLGRLFVRQDAISLPQNVTEWHTYRLVWENDQVSFKINGEQILRTNIVPNVPLGLVIWVDNQYASFPPTDRLSYGALPNLTPSWIEIGSLKINGKEVTVDK